MVIYKEKLAAGFTLIELLVVIAIISLLSSVVLSSLDGSRANARDARRLQDIRQIQTALEMYINVHGHPPFPEDDSFYTSHENETHKDWNLLAAELEPYIDTLPKDPINEWPLTYYYRTASYGQCPDYDGDSYLLLIATETASSEWKEYGIQGENNSAHRYCVYP